MTHPSVRRDKEYVLIEIIEHVWCPDCRLPSAIAMRYALVKRLDPTRWLGTLVTIACRGCGITSYATKTQ